MNVQKAKEFKEFRDNCVLPFFPSNLPHWTHRILMESVDNKEFFDDVQKILSVACDESTPEELDTVMHEIRRRTNTYFELAWKERDLAKRFDLCSIGFAYNGILECLDEFSTYTEGIIEKLREKYGEKFFSIIETVDRVYLSVDGKRIMDEITANKEINDPLLLKYIVLKKWQDLQHGYYIKNILPILWKTEEEYLTIFGKEIPFEVKNAQFLRKLINLKEKGTISLEDISKCILVGMDEEMIKFIGGKAYGLGLLNAEGIKVPNTIVIPVGYPLDKIDFSQFREDVKYAIRSSADIEDGNKNSFAGMFSSFLNIDSTQIKRNVEKVLESVNNGRVDAYIKSREINENPNMAVIVQEYCSPEYSGVFIGSDVASGILEWVEGNGEKLVSGKVIPNREIYSNKGNLENSLLCKDGIVGERLLEFQSLICPEGCLADFEWCIANEELILLQYRIATSNIKINTMSAAPSMIDGRQVFKGIAASSGEVSNLAQFVKITPDPNADDLKRIMNNWTDGKILMAWFTDPEYTELVARSSGIVTAVGGFLCHAAIIARELGIPAVIGIGQNEMKQLWNEEALYVNGTEGITHGITLKKTEERRKP